MYVHRWMLIALLIAAALCIGYDIREVAAQNGARAPRGARIQRVEIPPKATMRTNMPS